MALEQTTSSDILAEAQAAEDVLRRLNTGMELLREGQVNNLLLREGYPIECEMIMSGNVCIGEMDTSTSGVTEATLSRNELRALAYLIDPEWDEKIHDHAIDGVIMGPSGTRYRANVYLWGGKPRELDDKITGRLGCMIRVIPDKMPALDSLGLPPYMRSIADANYGLLLVTGPTGAGKTTTVASYIEHINTHRVGHIIKIEDPIEYMHTEAKCRISAREIGTNVNSFEDGVRDALRELPVAISVGEIRNTETLVQTMRAAHSGHFVTGTRHAPNLVAAVRALVDDLPGDKSANAKTVAETLLGVIFQVCVPGQDGDWHFVHEVLNVTNSESVKRLIEQQDWAALRTLMSQSKATGEAVMWQSLNNNLANLVAQGKITAEAADRRAYNRPGLHLAIQQAKGAA